MTINERLAIMDEIARKNDFEWGKFKRKRKQRYLHPGVEMLLKIVITFFMVILLGVVALVA